MPTIDVNGFTMYYEARGEGEPLLLLHGGTGVGADWRHVFPADPDGYRVVVPDLRGHGRSTNPSRQFTFRQSARDVAALLDHLGLARVKAIGMSMGAKTLLQLATADRDRVEAMVLVSATPYFPPQVRAAMAQFDADRLLATIAARTLIVHGDRDPFYAVEMAFELHRGIPDSALWVVPYGGHGPIFGKNAAQFAEIALGHLRGDRVTTNS